MSEAKIIKIRVQDRIAYCYENSIITAVNTGNMIRFDFDDEWEPESTTATRTARFVFDGVYLDIPFNGNICPLPSFSKYGNVFVGVFWGDMRSTTPAMITFVPSIVDGADFPADPPEEVYNRIIELLNDKINTESLEAEVKRAATEIKYGDGGILRISPEITKYFLQTGAVFEILGSDFSDFPVGYSAKIVCFNKLTGTALNMPLETTILKSYSDNGMALSEFNYGTATGGIELTVYKSSEDDGKFNWYISKSGGGSGYVPEKGKDYWTEADKEEIISETKESLNTESWTFELEDGSTVTKAVYIQ